ncbi:MAG: hypothetical protein MZV64_06590 [Ignavibacteriales bacterium]|nr:hypothetical protein [Ignavibacteriales bacterium]
MRSLGSAQALHRVYRNPMSPGWPARHSAPLQCGAEPLVVSGCLGTGPRSSRHYRDVMQFLRGDTPPLRAMPPMQLPRPQMTPLREGVPERAASPDPLCERGAPEAGVCAADFRRLRIRHPLSDRRHPPPVKYPVNTSACCAVESARSQKRLAGVVVAVDHADDLRERAGARARSRATGSARGGTIPRRGCCPPSSESRRRRACRARRGR